MKQEKKRTIIISADEAEQIEYLCTYEPKNESECFGINETITHTACFKDNIEMDIKCCGVDYEENGGNTAWTEAVLFKNGHEVACSEPSESYFGVWKLCYEDTEYVVEVVAESKIHWYELCFYGDEDSESKKYDKNKACSFVIKTEIPPVIKDEVALQVLFEDNKEDWTEELKKNLTCVMEITEDEASFFDIEDLCVRKETEYGIYYARK